MVVTHKLSGTSLRGRLVGHPDTIFFVYLGMTQFGDFKPRQTM